MVNNKGQITGATVAMMLLLLIVRQSYGAALTGSNMNMTVSDTAMSRDEPAVCDGNYTSGCGCYKNWCYKFITIPAKANEPWCYTQALGVPESQGQGQSLWAHCTGEQHGQCSSDMTCGDRQRFRGGEDWVPGLTGFWELDSINTTADRSPTTSSTSEEPNAAAATPDTAGSQNQTGAMCDGYSCGCRKKWCYKFTGAPTQSNQQPWCWTQKLGVVAPLSQWATCDDDEHSQCSPDMTCGNADRYTGTDTLLRPATPMDPTTNVCDGSYTLGCGCYRNFCYKFIDIPSRAYEPWCYTQQLGVSESSAQWATCEDDQHGQCDARMTCGDWQRYSGGTEAVPVTRATTIATTTKATTTTTQQGKPFACQGIQESGCACMAGLCRKYAMGLDGVFEKETAEWCYQAPLNWASNASARVAQCTVDADCDLRIQCVDGMYYGDEEGATSPDYVVKASEMMHFTGDGDF